MNVATPDLCRELYELSEWDDTSHLWHIPSWKQDEVVHYDLNAAYIVFDGTDGHDSVDNLSYIPAYDLGYLLRKLPADIRVKRDTRFPDDDMWVAACRNREVNHHTPEDAVAELATVLFKQGVLIKDKAA